MPEPVKHIAEDQNPVDFKLKGGKTLSVKSNMREGGKVAPQRIGQPTSKTFWAAMSHLAPNVDTTAEDFDYETSKKLFKATARNKTKEMLDAYWKNLFDCDYLLYVEKVLGKSGDDLSGKANVSFIPKKPPP